MTTLSAGTRAKSGYYLHLRSWRLHPVATSGETLPGGAGESYVAIPTLAALLLAPVLGAIFLVFLPVIGFVLTAVAVTGPVRRFANRVATGFAATVEPGWEPGHAHLTGKRGAAAAGPELAIPEEDPLEELEREIAALRMARRAAR